MGCDRKTITQKEGGGSEKTVVGSTTELSFAAGRMVPGSSCEFNMYIVHVYTDLDPATDTVTKSAPVVDSASCQYNMTRLSNDLTAITDYPSTAMNVIKCFSRGRPLYWRWCGLSPALGDTTYETDCVTVFVPSTGSQALSPFAASGGSGQSSINLNASENSVISYDETLDDIVSETVRLRNRRVLWFPVTKTKLKHTRYVIHSFVLTTRIIVDLRQQSKNVNKLTRGDFH